MPKAEKYEWTEVAKIPIRRGVSKEGHGPIYFSMHVADGTFGKGKRKRKFNLSNSVGGGDVIITFEKTKTDESRTYVIDVRKALELVIEAEGLAKK